MNRLLITLKTYGNFMPTILFHESDFIMVNGLVIKNRNSKSWLEQTHHALYINIDDDGRKFACLVGWDTSTNAIIGKELRSTFYSYDFM